jgi:4-aminobutyrate aminotransferase/4-aminobutyrate aminotransferase/(S)-3-amino-2-methylpropionate transaminase
MKQLVESISAPHIRTPPPGPRSAAALARMRARLHRGISYESIPFVLRRKRGSTLEDLDGNLYVDMVTGWGSTNVGACHPDVVEPTVEALRDFGVEITDYVCNEPAIALAEKLVEIAPGAIARVVPEISGTESVETAIKFMRARTGRPLILTFLGQYHGETQAALALGSQEPEGSRYIRESVGGYIHVPYPHPYRCPFHRDPATCDGVCVVDYVREHVLRYLTPPDRLAGVIIEPIAGEAGVLIPPMPFWEALVRLCREHGWLLCADEVQTGFGRTGRMFAVEHWGVEPDLMCLAKGLSGGVMPIGATLGTEAVMGDLEAYAGGTFAWVPPACVAALRGIEVIERDSLLGRAMHLEQITKDLLEPLVGRYEIVGDVRIKGLYVAVEFVLDRETKAPAVDIARRVHEACVRRGLANIYDDGMWLVRWQPALTIPEEMLRAAAAILEEAIEEVASAR